MIDIDGGDSDYEEMPDISILRGYNPNASKDDPDKLIVKSPDELDPVSHTKSTGEQNDLQPSWMNEGADEGFGNDGWAHEGFGNDVGDDDEDEDAPSNENIIVGQKIIEQRMRMGWSVDEVELEQSPLSGSPPIEEF